ncbi:SIR2 family protein [Ralstonia solanacearum]|uniref:SIR2 family protein n=1 Tax=Ralstonia solanacearum TaxID=305 RepID=UPI001FFB160E|nr:SIR2 family protein [Ralstonia solanacearum]MDB0529326.1 SIR2 family protein [Ralstonia solanacearum]
MSHILLLGAGFSRNWGGWLASEAFEYLLGCPEIRSDDELRRLLWRNQAAGGFENALADLQSANRADPQTHGTRLQNLMLAITRMFEDMNRGFLDRTDFEFHQHLGELVRSFLVRFDAIFTLNQDLLLEHHYLTENIALAAPHHWNGPQLPGLRPLAAAGEPAAQSWARRMWVPNGDHQVAPRLQPYFKLHGSSNWQKDDGNPMLILGGEKTREIGLYPVLTWYAEQFDAYLAQRDSRLMVIGYGFRDQHVNEAIARAVEQHGLKMFIVGPDGGDLARALNPTNRTPIRVGTPLEETFERCLVGASRRSLSEIFGRDAIERNKVLRFFDA